MHLSHYFLSERFRDCSCSTVFCQCFGRRPKGTLEEREQRAARHCGITLKQYRSKRAELLALLSTSALPVAQEGGRK